MLTVRGLRSGRSCSAGGPRGLTADLTSLRRGLRTKPRARRSQPQAVPSLRHGYRWLPNPRNAIDARADRLASHRVPASSEPPKPPKLLDQLRAALRLRHRSPRTENAYVHWVRRFIRFHGLRHPRELGRDEITAFLTDLAVQRRVSASTQSQALSALVFLYRHVLQQPFDWLDHIERARKPVRLPVVLSRAEVARVLARLRGTPELIAALVYGSGLHLLEACQLRIKDIDLDRHELLVRDGKAAKIGARCCHAT